jgi:hypothetical protein
MHPDRLRLAESMGAIAIDDYRLLRDLIAAGKAEPPFIVSHEPTLVEGTRYLLRQPGRRLAQGCPQAGKAA